MSRLVFLADRTAGLCCRVPRGAWQMEAAGRPYGCTCTGGLFLGGQCLPVVGVPWVGQEGA